MMLFHQKATVHAVDSVTCKTCSVEYIGETQRALRVHGNEHRDTVHLGHCSKSAMAEYVHIYKVPHKVDWNSLKVVDKSKNHAEHKVQEASHIFQRQPQMNRDEGVERSATWIAIL